MRRRKMAAIIAPIPGNGPGGKWLCVAVDGNLRFRSAFECESEQDAKDWLKKTRKHWRKLPDLEVCHRLAPNAKGEAPPRQVKHDLPKTDE